MNSHIRLVFASFALLALPGLSRAALLMGEDWRDITAEEKSATASTIDPDAGAEVLYEEIKLNDNSEMTGVDIKNLLQQPDSHDLSKISMIFRLKVYDNRGIESLKQFYVDQDERTSISEIVARVVCPEGEIIPLKSSDIFRRNVAEYDGKSAERVSFAFPRLKPGCIVDIALRGVRHTSMDGVFCPMYTILPVREGHILVRPHAGKRTTYNFSGLPEGLKMRWSGFLEGVAHDIPTVSTEPYSPPALSLAPWVMMHYAPYKEDVKKPDQYWKSYSVFLDDRVRYKVGTGEAIRAKAAALTAGVSDSKEKLRRLYDFCETEITNIDCAHSGYTPADYAAFDKEDDTSEILKNGRGHTGDIAILFASLARASGFEVNLALCNDRSYIEWSRDCMSEIMVPDLLVAIKDGNNWTFYQPGVPFLPFGMLRAGNEGAVAILGDPDKRSVTQTQVAPSSASQILRTGNFVLDEDGTLHGSGVFKYSGHLAYEAQNKWVAQSRNEREKSFSEEIREMIPGAEVTDVEFMNLNEPEKELEVHFTLSASGYADVSGDRILVPPSLFEKGITPVFTSDTRKAPIRFPYASETHDKIKIQYPVGFAVEAGLARAGLPPSKGIAFTCETGMANNDNAITFSRDFRNSLSRVSVNQYPVLKKIFDVVYQQDHHVISLHRIPPAPAESASATASTTAP